MSLALATSVERPPALCDEVEAKREPTLEAVLLEAWGALADGRTVVCPLCGGALAPRPAAGAAVAGGRCRDCGTQLG